MEIKGDWWGFMEIKGFLLLSRLLLWLERFWFVGGCGFSIEKTVGFCGFDGIYIFL